MRAFLLLLFCTLNWGASAHDFSATARLLEGSTITDTRKGADLQLNLTQGVPYRLFTLDNPRRLVLDFRRIDWASSDILNPSQTIPQVHTGTAAPDWSRMVLDLAESLRVDTADMQINSETGEAQLRIALRKISSDSFAAMAQNPDLPRSQPTPKSDKSGLHIMLDPGHGGVDPGAEHGALNEKDLMLSFVRELRELLLRSPDLTVSMTREGDDFVSLEARVAQAQQEGADLFLSFHADSLSKGRALGTVIYTLSDTASDKATEALIARHERKDLLAGTDLSGKDDALATVLLDLARQETAPRSERLAEALHLSLKQRKMPLNSRPLRHGGFSVLKAAGIPSVLIELGFLSSERDRKNLQDTAWRAQMTQSIRDAILAWQIADAAVSDLVRQ